jgi:hypothetical protein
MYLKSRDASGWVRGAWLAGMAAVTTIGVFSKESAVAILPVLVLYELVWWKSKKGTDDISGRPSGGVLASISGNVVCLLFARLKS